MLIRKSKPNPPLPTGIAKPGIPLISSAIVITSGFTSWINLLAKVR